jgi:uncharacterized protein (DUF2252 family)
MEVYNHIAVKSEVQQHFAPAKLFENRMPREESYAIGKSKRKTCSRESHAAWKAFSARVDPIELVMAAEKGRIADLLPLRHGRMAASPFTFYRGTALNMAADLSTTPSSGIQVQCCGDAHLLNFGGFATPERRIILSINDLDETLPAPWEWDLKRLTTSFVIACRENGLSESTARETALACARSYRERMKEFSEMKRMEFWYSALDTDTLLEDIKDPDLRRRVTKRLMQERGKSISENLFPKLTDTSGDDVVIKDKLPEIFHAEGIPPGQVMQIVKDTFLIYRENLHHASRILLDQFQLRDAAVKVVGIGSVGTACWVLLLMDGNGEPLFLQVKEARASVLEPYAGKSEFANNGYRIVHGYRIMQPYSDIFLGWTKGQGQLGRDFFLRQLRDMKVSFLVETFGKNEMEIIARWCGWALALSHARSGDAAMISGYMGKTDVFDEALALFSIAYADQNEKDYTIFKRCVQIGTLQVVYPEVN